MTFEHVTLLRCYVRQIDIGVTDMARKYLPASGTPVPANGSKNVHSHLALKAKKMISVIGRGASLVGESVSQEGVEILQPQTVFHLLHEFVFDPLAPSTPLLLLHSDSVSTAPTCRLGQPACYLKPTPECLCLFVCLQNVPTRGSGACQTHCFCESCTMLCGCQTLSQPMTYVTMHRAFLPSVHENSFTTS